MFRKLVVFLPQQEQVDYQLMQVFLMFKILLIILTMTNHILFQEHSNNYSNILMEQQLLHIIYFHYLVYSLLLLSNAQNIYLLLFCCHLFYNCFHHYFHWQNHLLHLYNISTNCYISYND